MSNVMFFCIPAHGHTNPTIGVVAELVRRGHRVRYYSFDEFREKIEAAGAEYRSCDQYLPPAPEDLDKVAGKDFAALIEMVADVTVNMNETICREVEEFRPDCIVSDSVCFWGKLVALRFGVPFVSSTTTFAFNRHTARLMKQSPMEVIRMIRGMPRIRAAMERLRGLGYEVENLQTILQNDNDTNTIVYTSETFQPMANTFSDRYAFVGPSVRGGVEPLSGRSRPQVYISLGTVLNKKAEFYRSCVDALKNLDCDVVMSIGRATDPALLGALPENIRVYPYVDQLAVLANTDVFLTHCGMNSVQESLYMGVPMVLFPQQSEQGAVAARAEELGAGVRLKRSSPREIRSAVQQVLTRPEYRENAQRLRADFLRSGGSVRAAEFIETVAGEC